MRIFHIQFCAVLVALIIGSTPSASAHDMIPGVGGFVGRILHPFIIIDHFVCLVLAGLIAGLYGPKSIWLSLASLIGGVIAGYLLQAVIPIIEIFWMLPLASALVAGLMVLGAVPLGPFRWLGVIIALGTAVGLETDPEGVLFIDRIDTLGGLVIAAAILLLIIGWPLSRASNPWISIMARIVSSWISAVAGLVLALNFQ